MFTNALYDLNANPLNSNEWAFPLTECFHILGFALSIGTIALVDLRLLGFGIKRACPAQLARNLEPWTRAGLGVMLITGPVIVSSDPLHYWYNGPFRFKMAALCIAILFHYTIHMKIIAADKINASAKLVGALSLTLWVSVIAGGIFIGFV